MWRTLWEPAGVFGLAVTGDALWAGTSFGLSRIDLKSGRVENLLPGGIEQTVSALWPIGNDRLIAQARQGMFYFDGRAWRQFQLGPDMYSPIEWGVDKDGNVWTLTSQGRYYSGYRMSGPTPPETGVWKGEQDPQHIVRWEISNCDQWQVLAQAGNVFRSTEECRARSQARQAIPAAMSEGVWVGVDGQKDAWWVTTGPHDNGQLVLGQIGENVSSTIRLAARSAYALAPDPNGGVWVGTNAGLAHWDGHSVQWKQLNTGGCSMPALPETLAVDNQGQVWTSSSAQIYTLDQPSNTWRAVSLTPPGSPNQHIMAMAPAPDGGLWIAQDDGLLRAGDKPLPPTNLPHPCWLRFLSTDGLGNVWGWSGSCSPLRHDPKLGDQGWTWYPKMDNTNQVAPGPEGQVYALGQGKLQVLDPAASSWRKLADAGGQKLAVGPQGQVWIAGQENGVLKLWQWTGQTLQAAPDKPESDLLEKLVIDRQGRVWVASNRRLHVYDGHEWRTIQTPMGYILDMAFGPDGRLWLRGSEQVGVYDPALDKN